MTGLEPVTSSLPRTHSTTELHRLLNVCNSEITESHTLLSGRPGSNRPPSAWKADALPNELLPLLISKSQVGREGFEPSKLSQRIYSPSHLATLESPLLFIPNTKRTRANGGIRTPDPLITNQLLWPAELHRQS